MLRKCIRCYLFIINFEQSSRRFGVNCTTFFADRHTVKFRKQAPGLIKALFEGLIFGGAYIRRGLSTEGNLRFKIDRAKVIVGSKFTVFALF